MGFLKSEKSLDRVSVDSTAELLLLGEEPDQEGSSWAALGDYRFWYDSSPPRSDTGLRPSPRIGDLSG